MLTRTTLTAIRLMMHLGLSQAREPAALREVARLLEESPTYLAKVAAQLARAGLIHARRGVTGGVALNRPIGQISLLNIVEAAQGTILGAFCHNTPDLRKACAFHRATAELHHVIIGVLSNWSLEDLLSCPAGSNQKDDCWMRIVVQANEPELAKHRHARLTARERKL